MAVAVVRAVRATRSTGLRRAGAALLDLDELDVEHEHALRRTFLPLVREVLRDPEATLLTDDHELHALGPAGDHAVEAELGGAARRQRRVEHLAVGLPADVADLHEVLRAG